MRRFVFCLAAALPLLVGPLQASSTGPTSAMLVEIAEFTGLSASPDGTFVAFRVQQASIEDNAYASAWHVAPIAGDAAPTRIGDGGEPMRIGGYPTTEQPQWSADSRSIYYRALRDGAVQIWRARRDGGGARQITADAANIVAFSLIDADRLVYEVGATREAIEQAELLEYDSGVLIDESVPVGRPVFRSNLVNGRLATRRYTGEWLLTDGLLAGADRQYKTVDLKRGRTRAATEGEIGAYTASRDGGDPDLAASAGALGFQASGGRVAYKSPDGAALHARLGDDAASERTCPDPACAAASWFSWAPKADQIVFASRDRSKSGAQSLHVWDVDADTVRLIVASEGSLNGGEYFDAKSRCALTAEHAICVAAEADGPPRLERIDLKSGARHVLFEPNQDIAAAGRTAAELLKWTDAEGKVFSGQFLPAGGVAPGVKPPLFITYYYCGGYLRGGVGDEWPLAALAASGVAVLCIHHPGGAGPDALDDYHVALSGIEAAIDMLAARGIDRTKVAMGGFSFGAEIVTWTAMRSNFLAAASMASPTLSESYYLHRTLMGEGFRASVKMRWGLGDPGESDEQWRLIGAQHNIDRLADLPILMQFSEEEYLSAIDYFAPLARRGAPVEMHVFPHEPHYKFLPRHKLAVYERNLDWIRFWLQGYIDPDPRKAGQYTRWRGLKARSAEDLAQP